MLLSRVVADGLHIYSSLRLLTPIARRNIFYPTASPPPLEGPSDSQNYPAQPRAHLSKEQFEAVRNPGGVSVFSGIDFGGLISQSPSETRLSWGRTPEERWANLPSRNEEKPPSIHAGRTVEVRSPGGVGQAYAKLQGIIRTNNVRRELKLGERHEKKGAKRRRLRSERWRRKFADEVRKKVKLVTEIRLRDRMWGARH